MLRALTPQRIGSLDERHPVPQAPANEYSGVLIRCHLGERVQQQSVRTNLDIQLRPFHGPSPITQCHTFKRFSLSQWRQPRIRLERVAHIQDEMLAVGKGQLKAGA